MKKTILLFAVLITGVPISCNFLGTNGSSTFRIEELEIAIGEFSDVTNLNSFYEVAFEPGWSDTLLASNMVIEIQAEQTFVIAESRSNWFMPSAFADPAPPRAESKLSLISIYSEESVFAGGKEYEAGENLTNLFSIQELRNEQPTTVLNYLKDFDEYFGQRLFFTLNTEIDQALTQSLKIDFTFENGTIASVTSPKIVVK